MLGPECPMNQDANDPTFVETLIEPLRSCATYTPKLGTSDADGIGLSGFQRIYSSDPLYHWVGLDSPLMYAAHKAAGGMTSIYRQLGTGCERLFRAVLQAQLGLTTENLRWGFDIEQDDGQSRRIELDARISVTDLITVTASDRFAEWLRDAAVFLELDRRKRRIKGAVFEVRQGYKSTDAKRQNADLTFGMRSMNDGHIPVIAVFSSQISETVLRRYRNGQILLLTGTRCGDPVKDTYAFFSDVIGYPLAEFFERNPVRIRAEVGVILRGLLSSE